MLQVLPMRLHAQSIGLIQIVNKYFSQNVYKSKFLRYKNHSIYNNPFLNPNTMHLTPKEEDKLKLLSLGIIAERRLKKGLKLNYPESVAYITSAALEGAREGKTVEEVMHDAANILTKDDVMEGVADMINLLQVEAVFTDGSRLVSIHRPIK